MSEQCGQIWRNFAPLAHREKRLAILKGFTQFLAKFRDTFGKFYVPLGNFSLL